MSSFSDFQLRPHLISFFHELQKRRFLNIGIHLYSAYSRCTGFGGFFPTYFLIFPLARHHSSTLQITVFCQIARINPGRTVPKSLHLSYNIPFLLLLLTRMPPPLPARLPVSNSRRQLSSKAPTSHPLSRISNQHQRSYKCHERTLTPGTV